jgi:hypothetical protein
MAWAKNRFTDIQRGGEKAKGEKEVEAKYVNVNQPNEQAKKA